MHETKIPQSVQFYVKHALSVLREQEAALHGVQLARGNGHILALELQDREGKIKRAMERLDEFRGHAEKNGVDADAFLKECGGVPEFERFGYPKPVQMRGIEQGAYDATACGIKLVGRPIHVGERDLSSDVKTRSFLSVGQPEMSFSASRHPFHGRVTLSSSRSTMRTLCMP